MTEKPKKTPKEELECSKKYVYDTGIIFECEDNIRVEIIGEDVVDLLNDLATKCSQLEKENEQLKENCKNYNWYKQYKILLNENEQLKQLIKIHKEDELETLNDLQRCEENNQRALSNIEKITNENEQLKQLIKKVLETTPIEHSLAIDLKNSIRELYE